MAGANTIEITDANFESEVLRSNVPVLVDFWAQWCGPCLMLAPTIDELAAEYQGKIKVGKLDIDKSPQRAAQYGVMSIPTIILFDNGQPAQKLVGVKPKREYKSILDARVGAAG